MEKCNRKTDAIRRFFREIRLFREWDYTVFVLFFYFFVFRETLETKLNVSSYIDELLACSAIPLFFVLLLRKRFVRVESYSVGIALFFLSGMLSAVIYCYQPAIAVLGDAFLNIKFWLAIFVGKCFFDRLFLRKYAKHIFFHVRLLFWLFSILLALDSLFGIFPPARDHGLLVTHLFYGLPTTFAWTCGLLSVMLLSLHRYLPKAGVYFVLTVLLMATTFKAKALGSAVVGLFLFFWVVLAKKRIRPLPILLVGALALLVGWNKVYYYFMSEIHTGVARYRLLVSAFEVAADHPFLGAGFGAFSCYLSGVYYSPLYYMYNLWNVFGIGYNGYSFISDMFWPMILGESGWFGLLCYCSALIALLLRCFDLRKRDENAHAASLMILAVILISSLAESAFAHPLAIPFGLWMGGILVWDKKSNAPVSDVKPLSYGEEWILRERMDR